MFDLREGSPVIDGFSYDLTMRMVPSSYLALALGQMEPLRKAGGYRPRWYVVPEPSLENIPAYDTYEQEVRIVPGSYLYGMIFNVVQLTLPLPPAIPGPPLAIRITDVDTGIAFMDDFLFGGNVQGNYLIGSLYTRPGRPFLFGEPRLIPDPGALQVEIANLGTTDSGQAQLILLCAEPCRVVEAAPGSRGCVQ